MRGLGQRKCPTENRWAFRLVEMRRIELLTFALRIAISRHQRLITLTFFCGSKLCSKAIWEFWQDPPRPSFLHDSAGSAWHSCPCKNPAFRKTAPFGLGLTPLLAQFPRVPALIVDDIPVCLRPGWRDTVTRPR